ncbi:Hypothetical predicted protein [Mytilus galloprovincialis]|uniref:Peptidase A2 domain-containing protein n=1 Tax=Mytilus galloprovincialis TaxID=29158 RepID=A0A8B6GHX3_MYTGA|nr:Hypothetical predicted protein [Mytilus galloprovincialis]
MKGMERKWRDEMEYMKDTINQIKKTGTSSQGRSQYRPRQNQGRDRSTWSAIIVTNKTTFNDVHKDKTTLNDVDTDTTECGKPVVCEEESVGNKNDNVFENNSVEKGQKTTVLSLELGDTPLVAAVDTAAEVTIISDKVFESLKKKPPMLRETVMHAAGRGMKMKTLVGLNFMVRYGVKVDLEKITFNIGGENVRNVPWTEETYTCCIQSSDWKEDCSSASFSSTCACKVRKPT